jgi:serine/threonine protein phosphatase PrpC
VPAAEPPVSEGQATTAPAPEATTGGTEPQTGVEERAGEAWVGAREAARGEATRSEGMVPPDGTASREQPAKEAARVGETVQDTRAEVEAEMPAQDVGSEEGAGEGRTADETGATSGAAEAPGEVAALPEAPSVEVSSVEERAPEAPATEAGAAEAASADMLPWRDEPAEPPPLQPGELIDGRYRIVELLSTGQAGVLYTARDLRRCPQCGYDQNSPDQAFCTSCGAVLDQKPLVRVLQHPSGQQPPPEVEVLDHVVDGERTYWVWKAPGKQTDVLGGSEEPMRLKVGQRTHPGQTRELDEDSLFTLTLTRTFEGFESANALFVVADGMGGHEAGEVASRIAIRALADAVLRDVFARQLAGAELDDEAIRAAFEHAVQVANEQVFLERERRDNDMGTTVTAALLRDWTLFVAHVGDCRAYRWGKDGLQQLTTDHSVVASMVASGAAQPDAVYTHPHRSVIYRSVGDQPSVEVDTAVLSVEPGDRLVLCCDGLWEMLRDDGIEEVLLSEADPQRASDVMVAQANEAGGPDNISVIVVQL